MSLSSVFEWSHVSRSGERVQLHVRVRLHWRQVWDRYAKNHISVLLLPLLLSSHLLVIVDVIMLLVSLFWVIHLYYSHNSFAVLVYFQITTSVTLIRVWMEPRVSIWWTLTTARAHQVSPVIDVRQVCLKTTAFLVTDIHQPFCIKAPDNYYCYCHL